MRFIRLATLFITAIFCAAFNVAAYETEKKVVLKGFGDQELRMISTADVDLFLPLIEAFQKRHPALTIYYIQASSNAVFEAITSSRDYYDIAISSAMDLQTKAANDGFALEYSSAITAAFPTWSRWRNQVFGFSQEPAVLVASKNAFKGMITPKSRPELIEILRSNPDRFRDKIGTYDVRSSGLGYLFATQDARQSDSYWRLAEVMGAHHPKLYCCSNSMIDAINSKEILLAYNVLGPYARAKIQAETGSFIVPLSDYTNVMMRTVLIPSRAKNPRIAEQFIDFLLSGTGRNIMKNEVRLQPLVPESLETNHSMRPIKLGPGLLVYLDQLKRKGFFEEWENSMLQKKGK
jgi:iron(III) transport system substrate-binding protein